MRPRDEKAVITKAINRFLNNSNLLKKITSEYSSGESYSVIVTPGSDRLLLTSFTKQGTFVNRASIPRFSDYVVRNKGYADFMSKFKKDFNAETKIKTN